MSVAAPETVELPIAVEPTLIQATLGAVSSALTMCETSAKCVSISTVPASDRGIVTGMIGVHGKVSGFITVNMAEKVALRAVQGLLQESCPELTSQVIDGVGEITNIVVGGIKSTLGKTPWAFSNITVPSVIVGTSYHIAYARGLDYLCAAFEHDDPEAIMLEDRMLQVSISLLRL